MNADNHQSTVSITINKQDNTHVLSQEKITEEVPIQELMFSESAKRATRFMIFLICIFFLIIGRYTVPDIEIENVKDYIMDGLQFANDFINKAGNESYRDGFQMLCSFFMDLVFLITFGYWVLRGTNCRLPLTFALFYITRAIVQKVWLSPFPEGFYWESPGIPSLVVPYGRGSDFFFSGHSGFLIICACEWNKLKNNKIRNFIIGAAVYTVMILLIYRIHYSIDIFTGVFFSEWCHGKADKYIGDIEKIPRKFIQLAQGRFLLFDKNAKPEKLNQVVQPEQEQDISP